MSSSCPSRLSGQFAFLYVFIVVSFQLYSFLGPVFPEESPDPLRPWPAKAIIEDKWINQYSLLFVIKCYTSTKGFIYIILNSKNLLGIIDEVSELVIVVNSDFCVAQLSNRLVLRPGCNGSRKKTAYEMKQHRLLFLEEQSSFSPISQPCSDLVHYFSNCN